MLRPKKNMMSFTKIFSQTPLQKNIQNSFVIWNGNILQDQKSLPSISEWIITCVESIPALSLRLVSVSLKTSLLTETSICELQLEMLKNDASYYKDKLTYICWKLTAEPVQMQC